MEHARHVFRVLLVLVVAVTVFILGRALLVPRSYGLYGAYRADNVVEQAKVREPRHAGPESCVPCHAQESQKRTAGAHKSVSCEICHAPLASHVRAGVIEAPMAVDRSWQLCARCHRKIAGRPEKFPQVVIDQHVPAALEAGVCIQCHDPHSPKT